MDITRKIERNRMDMLRQRLAQHVRVGLRGRGDDLSLSLGELEEVFDDLLFAFQPSARANSSWEFPVFLDAIIWSLLWGGMYG